MGGYGGVERKCFIVANKFTFSTVYSISIILCDRLAHCLTV